MKRHSFLQFNPNSYKKHLSPFGQNVLDTLIMHWRTGFNNTGRRGRHQLDENKRNTSWRESCSGSRHVSCSPTPVSRTHCSSDVYQTKSNDTFTLPPVPGYQSKRAKKQILHFHNEPEVQINQAHLHNIPNDDLPSVIITSSIELVKAAEIAATNDDEILTANDMITPVINFADKRNKKLLLSRSCDVNIDIPAKEFLQILNKGNNDNENEASIETELMSRDNNIVCKDVNWGDMFDTDLFHDIDDTEYLMRPGQNKETSFKMQFPCDTERVEQCAEKNKSTVANITTKKSNKRKTANQTKVTETIVKKVKKATNKQDSTENVTKNNFRKEKYAKAVKNWLDDVDPSMQIEEQLPENNIETKDKEENLPTVSTVAEKVANNDIIIPPSKTEVAQSLSIVIEKKPKEMKKKVIQATLAQKDGKMKFKLPIKDQTENKTEAATATDKETKIKDVVKEKKAKPKFVAPIKSQIPVRSVEFDVCTVDESNIQQKNNITNFENDELVMVLVYSNGFCQLNNEHTEETCIPEGILVQRDDNYFYLKGDNLEYGAIIKELLEKVHVICYNGKRLLIYLLSKYNIELQQGAFNISDAKIGGSLIEPDSPPENFTELQKLLNFSPEYTIATDSVLQKAAWYSTLLKECFAKLKSLLIGNSVWSVFVDIEMRLLPVIAGMEYRGVTVDLEKLKFMEDILLTKMKTVEQDCYKAAGKTFQINSTLQVRTILYDELQLDTKSNLKIKETISKGAKSTSETMLRGLVSVHPLPKLILEYRHLHKAHATFLTGVAQHVKDGLVKPTWVQMAAATGRIASNNPNLQAIPKAPFSLVMFPDDAEPQEPPLNFRSIYTARAGCALLAADFKHVESRVFAHAAGDAALLAALRSADLFRVLAAQWLGKPAEAVSDADRGRTKRVVYASLYGAGARKLAEILREPYDQTLAVIASFHRTFPALKEFGLRAVELASRGALRSLCGRARRLPDIASADAARRAHAERQAVNFVVQGSAADLCKAAMAAVERRLRGAGLAGRLLLQIHDELVWELRRDQLRPAAVIIKEVMENIGHECGLAATLPVEMRCGPNWGEMLPYSPEED